LPVSQYLIIKTPQAVMATTSSQGSNLFLILGLGFCMEAIRFWILDFGF
jgi:hypothetical protein